MDIKINKQLFKKAKTQNVKYFYDSIFVKSFPGGSEGKEYLPAMQETWVQSLGQEDPLEGGMVTHSSILAWRIPWTEEPGELQSTLHVL